MSNDYAVISKRRPVRKEFQTSLDTLENFSKEELIIRVQQLEAYVFQLKNIIKKENTKTAENIAKTCSKKPREFNWSKHHKRHILLKFLYLGWDYRGYTVQDDSSNTIEHHLFTALTRACLIKDRESSNYHRCGRTDKGVSAFSQVVSIDVRSCLTLETEDNLEKELPYCKMLNRLLPNDIRAIAWRPAPSATTSARFDCQRRTYRYFFPRGNLNLTAMQEAASFLVGIHDFRNLCKMDVGNGVLHYNRSIQAAYIRMCSSLNSENIKHACKFSCEISDKDIVSRGTDHSIPLDNSILDLNSRNSRFESSSCEPCSSSAQHLNSRFESSSCEPCSSSAQHLNRGSAYDICELVITGKAFLWHQIRCIVSVLFLIANGKESPLVIKSLLDPEVCPQKPQYSLASEIPLCLFECDYDLPGDWYIEQEQHSKLVTALQAAWTGNAVKAEMMQQMLQVLEKNLSTPVYHQVDSLIEGVQSKIYQPLLQRDKCLSLEKKIIHYVKRRKLEIEEKEELNTSR